MATVDHYVGAKEHSIASKTYLNYHKYVPYEYIEYVMGEQVNTKIKNYYEFFKNIDSDEEFLKNAKHKIDSSGLWITENKNSEIECYHSYFSHDYKNMSENMVNNFYTNVVQKIEPSRLKELRTKELDIGLEGISISLEGEVLKYITVFRPNSNVLTYFSDLQQIEDIQTFLDLNYTGVKKIQDNSLGVFKFPIRIQFDSTDNGKISIELVSEFFQKQYYSSGDSYLDRKQKYFDRMLECKLLDSEEIEYCKQHSPVWQQFSIKFKWQDGKLIDKKLYTFDVVDFEEVK